MVHALQPLRTGPQGSLEHYRERIQGFTSGYGHVVMLGDSMGATASLLFSPLASAVISFCPQVGNQLGGAAARAAKF